MVFPFQQVYYDISGICNAQCPWCERGSRKNGFLPGLPVAKEAFALARDVSINLRNLLKNSVIASDAVINLHNWGEPLLNPEFLLILRVIKQLGLNCSFSTNGSKVVVFKDGDLDHVKNVLISMPGFSQNSYNHAHRFEFNVIQRSIKRLIKNIKSISPSTQITLSVHVYRHNLEEMKLLQEFANEMNVIFTPSLAYFNSFNLFLQYCEGNMREDIMEKARKALFLPPLDKIKEMRPGEFECPQWSMLSISWNGYLSLGCCASLDNNTYNISPIRDMKRDDIENILSIEGKRSNYPVCKKCIENNIDFLIHRSDAYYGEALRGII